MLERLSSAQRDRAVARIVVSDQATVTTQLSPLNREPIVSIPHTDEAAADRAFAAARAAQPAWASKSVAERARIISRFHDLILENRELLCDLSQTENGKCRADAHDEVLDIAQNCRYYVKQAPRLLRPTKKRGAFPVVTSTTVLRHPIGVIGVISPWNYPLNVGLCDLIPALLAGNTVVWKPDLQTMLCALIPLDLLYQAGLPEGVVQVLAGEGPVVGPMVTNRADYVMFTGSTRVGREVAQRCGERLIGVSLELGGKNACIVMPDADIDRAVQVAVRGAFANAGQLCIGTERVMVHSSIADEFVPKFVKAVSEIKVGSSVGWGSEMGPLISEGQLARARAHVEDAVSKGARVLTGGKHRPDIGPLVYEPTVLADVTDEMMVCRTETFGPVCAIYIGDDEDQLVARVNDTGLGLSATICSGSTARAAALGKRLMAGGVNINDPFSAAFASIDAPMGGMGDSGLGRRHGSEGILKYTESQTIATQRLMQLSPQWGMTDEQWAGLAVRLVRILKRLGIK